MSEDVYLEANGEFFGVSKETFQAMCRGEAPEKIEELLETFRNARQESKECADFPEQERHACRVGFLVGLKMARVGFGG